MLMSMAPQIMDKAGQMSGQGAKLAMAGGQMIAGAINRKKADAAIPMSENPMERQMLNTIRRRRQALQTGTANSANTAAMRQMAKGYQTGAARSGSPANFGQFNQLMSNAAKNLADSNAEQLNQTLGLELKQTGDMANLANDLALLRSSRISAQAENQMKAGTQNLLATLGGGPEAAAKKKKLLEEATKGLPTDTKGSGSVDPNIVLGSQSANTGLPVSNYWGLL
jgi:hypothetical protein